MVASVICFSQSINIAYSAEKPVRIVAIGNWPDSEPFAATIKNGLNLAGQQVGATVEYRNPSDGDLAEMARIVEQATASNPDGIILPVPDFDLLKTPIETAVKKGIPVITMNVGSDAEAKKLGALLHVGQSEYDGGFASGQRLKAAGVTHFICMNAYPEVISMTQRCNGVADGLGVPLGDQMVDIGKDPGEQKNRVLAFFHAHPKTNGIMSLGPESAEVAIAAVDDLHLASKVTVGTFDLSPVVVAGIESGKLLFAGDQQPFLQGYLPVIFLVNYVRYGVRPVTSITSGYSFVTKDNIAKVKEFAGVYR